MKKIVCMTLVCLMLFSNVCAMNINQAFNQIKKEYPKIVQRLNAGGATDADIINFLEDVSEYLKDKNVTITSENVDALALEAIQKAIYYKENLPVYEALTTEFAAEALYFVANKQLPPSLMPFYNASKKILLESPELWKNSGSNNTGKPSENKQEHTGKFSDLGNVVWAQEAINALVNEGIINGYEDGTFKPEKNITRAEFTKIIVSALGMESYGTMINFTDVNEGDWFYPYIAAAVEYEIVKGYDTGEFRPHDNITREDICVIVYRAMDLSESNIAYAPVINFTDKDDISPYAEVAIARMNEAGIVNGMGDGTFAPKANATRAQAAKIIYSAFR